MDTTHSLPKNQLMPYDLRPMRLGDVPQVLEIEREAFPEIWPPSPFARQLHSRPMSLLVAWSREEPPGPNLEPRMRTANGYSASLLGLLLRKIRGLPSEPIEATREPVIGFVSTSFMHDEAHITSIGVRKAYRGRGVGELLLTGAIEAAMARASRVVTLEVRVSNYVAQSLYTKYGFAKVGIRKRYYTNNNEDASIMTTDEISSPGYQEMFRRLVQTHVDRCDETLRRTP